MSKIKISQQPENQNKMYLKEKYGEVKLRILPYHITEDPVIDVPPMGSDDNKDIFKKSTDNK